MVFYAAEELIKSLHIARESIDCLIFVSQTADYMIPATSPMMQARLGLKEATFTLDLNQGCTGYTDGLIVAESVMKGMGFQKVLLLVGDTLSKITDPSDKGTSLLFGDGAAATIIENDENEIHFVTGSDGSGNLYIHQEVGYRNGLSSSSRIKPTDMNLVLDGAQIFNFTIKRVPPMVKELLSRRGWQPSDVDSFVFHQANSFIIKYLAKKMKLDVNKQVPLSLDRFGNTSSASIPITLVTEMKEQLATPMKLVLVGFGVGLAWSSVAFESDEVTICPLLEI